MKIFYFSLLLVYIFLGSCSQGEAAPSAVQVTGSSSRGLLFINCKAVSADEVEFEFSAPVTVKSINFDPALSVASVENGSTVKVFLNEVPEPGEQFTADILAEDEDRNTINVLAPFRARNNRMPKLVINEVCTEYTTVTAGKKEEFIELKIKTDGNLGAMRVFILGNSNAAKQTIFEFMPKEVKGGDYLTIHLRKWDDSCKDEYGSGKNESGGLLSSADAWDFWMPGEPLKLIHKAVSAVYVLDQDDKVLDAVMFSATSESWWTKDYFAETAEFLFKQGAWKTADGLLCGPSASVNSSTATATRTICRDETLEDTNTAADWYITVGSGATPGKQNNPGRYQPK